MNYRIAVGYSLSPPNPAKIVIGLAEIAERAVVRLKRVGCSRLKTRWKMQVVATRLKKMAYSHQLRMWIVYQPPVAEKRTGVGIGVGVVVQLRSKMRSVARIVEWMQIAYPVFQFDLIQKIGRCVSAPKSPKTHPFPGLMLILSLQKTGHVWRGGVVSRSEHVLFFLALFDCYWKLPFAPQRIVAFLSPADLAGTTV